MTTDNKKEIGFGLIGIGHGAELMGITDEVGTNLVIKGVCSATKSKVNAFAKRWNIDYATTDYKELIHRDDIDIIGIFSPDDMHYDHIKESITAGKHVVVTKPMVTKIEDAREIVQLAKEYNRKILVGETMRFEPEVRNLRDLVNDGTFGELLFARTHYVHDMRPIFEMTPWRATQKDFLIGAMCHAIDPILWFLGDAVEVSAYGRKSPILKGYEKESLFSLNIKFKNGAIGNAIGLYGIVHPPNPPMSMYEVSIFGAKGSASANVSDHEEGQLHMVLDNMSGKPTMKGNFKSNPNGIYGHTDDLKNYLLYFENCINDDIQPGPNEIDGFKTLAVSYAAWESIHTGKPAKVEQLA